MKLMILISVTLFSTLGGWLGAIMDHGNWLGGWSILFAGVGGLVGVWAGYRAGQYFGF